MGLGVHRANSYVPTDPADEPSINLTLDGGGGTSGGTAEAVVSWIDGFMAEPRRQDNIVKLRNSGADEAHLAVIAHMSGVDFAVWRAIEDYDSTGVVPTRPPMVPEAVTHLWLFAVPSGRTCLSVVKKAGCFSRTRISCNPSLEIFPSVHVHGRNCRLRPFPYAGEAAHVRMRVDLVGDRRHQLLERDRGRAGGRMSSQRVPQSLRHRRSLIVAGVGEAYKIVSDRWKTALWSGQRDTSADVPPVRCGRIHASIVRTRRSSISFSNTL
jgi:hypothetical protein